MESAAIQPWAQKVPCAQCGAPLPVSLDRAEVACESCGTSTQVPDALLAQARAYLEKLLAEHQAEQDERRRAAQSRHDKRNTWWAVAAVVTFACLVVAWPLAFAFSGGEGGPAILGLAAFTGLTVNRMIFSLWANISTPPKWYRLPAVKVGKVRAKARCGSCGGAVIFEEGSTQVRCAFCDATVVAPGSVGQAAIAGAKGRVVEAKAVADVEQAAAFAAYDKAVMPGVVGTFAGAFLIVGGTAVALVVSASHPVFSVGTTGTVLALVGSVALGLAAVFWERRD